MARLSAWLASSGVTNLVPAGNLRFSQYDLLLQAAVSGQGIALGRSPLIDDVLARGDLIAPFPSRYHVPRAYFSLCAGQSSGRDEVRQFVAWLVSEAEALTALPEDAPEALAASPEDAPEALTASPEDAPEARGLPDLAGDASDVQAA